MVNYALLIVIHLELSKFKYVSNYMLFYVKNLKTSDHLDILYVDTYMPILCILQIFLKSNQNCTC